MGKILINRPVYCLTSDIDWASEDSITDLLSLASDADVTPTLFATHDSAAVREFSVRHADSVGIHPNFLAGSTQGSDPGAVVDHLLTLYPEAQAFRSHSFVDGTHTLRMLAARGIRYDSNLCLYLQPQIVPLQLGAVPRMVRLPVFWEDDIHWAHEPDNWDFGNFAAAFSAPGLKIINVHPSVIALNAASDADYVRHKAHHPTLTADQARRLRTSGPGARAFLLDLFDFVKARNERFYTLAEIYRMFPIDAFMTRANESEGRETTYSQEDFGRYWSLPDSAKQELVRAGYEQRNSRDPYATSRDFHARELEILALARSLGEPGKVLDLGCGNGYTLLSLAERLESWPLTGVDFSSNMIAGAQYIAHERAQRLMSKPEFICADAVSYLESLPSASVRYVITERFVQNLPSVDWQQRVVAEIHRVLEPGGRYLMCEGSKAGFDALNSLRARVGLEVTPENDAANISALRIDDAAFEEYAEVDVGFTLAAKHGFSTYFVVSRVLHPLMVAPQRPRFDSPFNHYGRLIQEHADFAPGYGSNVLWVLQKVSDT